MIKKFEEFNRGLIAYHGTYSDIIEFSTVSAEKHGGFDTELGIHFGSREAAIDRLKSNAGDEDFELGQVSPGAKIIEADTGIKKPLKVSDDIGDWSNVSKLKKLLGITDMNSVSQIKDYLINAGYDGIEYPNQYEGVKGDSSYIVFFTQRIEILNIERLK